MSRIKGFSYGKSEKDAKRWVQLVRSGKPQQAAAQVRDQQQRAQRKTAEAIDAEMERLARLP